MTAPTTGPRHGELRRATVLFLDIVGYSSLSERLGTESAYLVVTQCLRSFDGIARAHGGSVDKYLGDRLMAVFGHPIPVARPANAAVRAALEMREWMARYAAEARLPAALGLHIGINSGPLVAGDVRGSVVREFHVLGDAVNVAARLNGRASPGEVFVGPETFEQTRDEFEFRALEPLRLKGKSAPVPAFALVDARGDLVLGDPSAAASAEAGILIGRDTELARLRRHAARVADGSGSFILLSGPEGIGKSRLLAALADSPELAGIATRTIRFLATAADPRVESAIGELRPAEATARPEAILLDDVQWLGERSLGAARALVERTAREPLLVVMALRGQPARAAEGLRRWLAERPREEAEEIALDELAPEAASRLLDRLPGARALDADVRALVAARGGGNPGRLATAIHLAPTLRSEREQGRRIQDRSSESERRRTAILFADITGFTAMTERVGAERAYPVVAECLQRLDQTAREFGGTVDHYLGDCVLALFGVPEALEDAPRSAINAAIEMRRRVHEFNREHGLDSPLDVHSGIATGVGIAGDISGPLIREFAVMGDHVDRAYALTDLASAGEIFVDETTRKHADSFFDFEALADEPSVGAAGRRAHRVSSSRVQRHRARLGSGRQVFSALVGRSEEIEQMRKRLASLSRGEGGAISLIAEAGLGKSRLVAELRASPEARDLTWLEGQSISNGRNLSFHPFADLCRGWAGIDDEDDDEAAGDKIRRSVDAALAPAEASDLLPFLKSLLGITLETEERQRLALLPGDLLERLMRRSTARLLGRLAELHPVVVVMDDLHWADLSSIEMLESLLPLAADGRLLLLNVFRPGFAETSDRVGAAARARLDKRHLELPLRPLDTQAARALVRNVFGAGDVPHATRQLIEEKAKGNPFYIEEVVRALLDAGAVELRNGSLHATDLLESFEIPGSVQDVVMARVDRLDLARRRVLQVASVIGGTFHFDVLQTLSDRADDLESLLEELLDAEFIVPDDRMQGREYAFKHPLIQEVTYGSLLESRRREIHVQVGRAIESRLPPETPGLESMLAYHYTMGADLQQAELHLFRAGEEAARSAASSEALHFFREASRLYLENHGENADPEKKAMLARNIARALFHRGQLIEAEEKFNDAIAQLGQPVPHGQAALAARLALRVAPMAARLYGGRLLTRRPPATDREREVISLMLERGMCEITANPTRFVLDSLDTLATTLRLDPDTLPTATRVLAGASMIFAYSGISFGLSRRLLEIARERVDDADLQGAVMYGVTNFLHNVFEGDWSERHDLDEGLLRRAIDHGLIWDVLTYLGFHAERYIGKGDFARARERIEEVRRLWDRYAHDLGRSTFHALTTYLALEQGRYAEAIEAAETYYEENPEPLLHILALAGKGRAQARLGQLEAAGETLGRCEAIVREVGRAQVPPYQLSQWLRARLVLDVAHLERAGLGGVASDIRKRRRAARRTARSALRAADRCALRRVEIWRLAATLDWLSGTRARAVRGWEKALTEAERLGARPEAARTHAEVARRASGSDVRVAGATAEEHRERARTAFEALALENESAEIGTVAPYPSPRPPDTL